LFSSWLFAHIFVTSNSVPVAFVEDGANFGEGLPVVIFVNLTSMTLTFAKSDPVVALLGLDYTCVQNLVKIGPFL
jgi:hypothetical protein